MQVDDDANEYSPAPHDMQVDLEVAPVDAEYSPAEQPLQLAAPKMLLYWPARQDIQVDDDVAPMEAEYIPA